MTETIPLKISQPKGQIEDCLIEVSLPPVPKLVFWAPSLQRCEFVDRDLFEALVQLRRMLEKSGCKALCAGARVDVFPSGTSRSMGAGRKAYINRIGEPTAASDLLDIFDYAGPELIGSVCEQQQFHDKELSLLKNYSDYYTP